MASETILKTEIKTFPIKSKWAKNYRNNLAANLFNFESQIVQGFNLEEVTATALKVPSIKAKILNFQVNKELLLKLLSTGDCYVCNGTDKKYEFPV